MAGYANWIQSVEYSPSIAEIFSTLAFLGAYIPSDTDIWANTCPIGQVWSLNVEEHSCLWLAQGVILTGGARIQSGVLVFMSLSVLATMILFGS